MGTFNQNLASALRYAPSFRQEKSEYTYIWLRDPPDSMALSCIERLGGGGKGDEIYQHQKREQPRHSCKFALFLN